MTYHHVWHMCGCWREQHDEYHVWNRTLFTIVNFCIQLQFKMGCCCSNFSFLMLTVVCLVFFIFLTFVLRYVGSGYANVFFRPCLYLLGLILSLYLVRILYFVVIWILIRLHQSKQAHSTTWQALLNCKYQILSIYPCCSLQNMNTVLILESCMI